MPSTNPTHAKLEAYIDSFGFKKFTGEELTEYWTRKRGKVSNSCPPEALWPNIIPTLAVLDAIRADLGKPIQILSTYRDEDYNAAVGGERNSFHMRFMAIDWTADASINAMHAAAKAQRGKKFKLKDGRTFTFQGGIGKYPSSHFIHIDCRSYAANW